MSGAARRAAGLVLLAVLLAVTCGLLGVWQWDRHVARDKAVAVIEAGYGADPVPLADLLSSPDDPLAGDEVWRPVTVVGHYDAASTALLRNRPINSQSGFHLLVPFVVTDAGPPPDDAQADPQADPPAVLVVDRGWVRSGTSSGRPEVLPDPPAGTIEITVRLRADEPAAARDAPAGQVQAISIDQVLVAGGLEPGAVVPYAAYGVLAAEQSIVPDDVGVLPRPSTDPGSHLSYAFQWWTFALGSLIGFSILARRELRDRAAPGERASGPRPPSARRRGRGPSAEEVEDALIDSQLH